MTERLVDIPVTRETRDWIIATKGDLTYDQFFSKIRRLAEMSRLPRLSIFTQIKNEDGSIGPLQKLEFSQKEGMEVKAQNG